MEIKCSVQEIKEIMKSFQLKEDKKTPVAGTTDAFIKLNTKKINLDTMRCQ